MKISKMIENINSVNVSVEKMVDSFSLLHKKSDFGVSAQKDVNEKILYGNFMKLFDLHDEDETEGA